MAPSIDEPAGGSHPLTDLEAELVAMRSQVAHLRSKNARLLRLLDLTPAQGAPSGSGTDGVLRRSPGLGPSWFIAVDEGCVLRRSVRCS